MKHLSYDETYNMSSDVIKGLTVALIYHLLTHFVDNEEQLLEEKAVRRMLYVGVGITFYHLMMRKYVVDKLFCRETLKEQPN